MGTSVRLSTSSITSAYKKKKDKNSVQHSHSSRLRQQPLHSRRLSARVFASSLSLSSLGSGQGSAPSPARSFFVGSWDEDEGDDSCYLNALCYPDAILDEHQDEFPETHLVSGNPASAKSPDTWGKSKDEPSPSSSTGNTPALLSQHSSLRRGATAALLKAEENYRRAWIELQRAERLLLSTRQVASELHALPRSQSDQSVDIPILPSVAFPLTGGIDFQCSGSDVEGGGGSSLPVDLAYDDGVWCIEACTNEPDSPVVRGESRNLSSGTLVENAILDAEGAMSRSRAAVDTAARDLIARLQEEELQAEVMDRHIEALDQGAQHQVAKWLVEEMESLFARSGNEPGLEVGSETAPVSLAVPLNLDLAMQGYDEHAVRFLCHLPYDQVMKIRTIPPTQETKSLVAVSAAADKLERILSQPSALPANEGGRQISAVLEERWEPLGTSAVEGAVLPPVVGSGQGIIQSDQRSGDVISDRLNGATEQKLGGRGPSPKYHSKLVVLGCCVCSLAAYMVANFDLAVLAKDVAVILTAMSLAFIAAQFVWRNGDYSDSSESEDSDDDCLDQPSGSLASNTCGALGLGGKRGLIRGRGPSWDQVIWLLGGFAVVLSLSTMIALACKTAQAGLAALTNFACSSLVRALPSGAGAAAAGFLPSQTSASLVQHVTTSLWLVLGGEMFSSGVESLGSAAAWAMLLLCVAFSIASAPVCIASSTSRRVHELLALARSRGPSKSS